MRLKMAILLVVVILVVGFGYWFLNPVVKYANSEGHAGHWFGEGQIFKVSGPALIWFSSDYPFEVKTTNGEIRRQAEQRGLDYDLMIEMSSSSSWEIIQATDTVIVVVDFHSDSTTGKLEVYRTNEHLLTQIVDFLVPAARQRPFFAMIFVAGIIGAIFTSGFWRWKINAR